MTDDNNRAPEKEDQPSSEDRPFGDKTASDARALAQFMVSAP